MEKAKGGGGGGSNSYAGSCNHNKSKDSNGKGKSKRNGQERAMMEVASHNRRSRFAYSQCLGCGYLASVSELGEFQSWMISGSLDDDGGEENGASDETNPGPAGICSDAIIPGHGDADEEMVAFMTFHT